MIKSIGIFQIVIQAPNFAQMLRREYSFKKKYPCRAKNQDSDNFFKMADMSVKEIIKFAQKCAHLSNCDDGVKSYSLEHVENSSWTLRFTRKLLCAIISTWNQNSMISDQ